MNNKLVCKDQTNSTFFCKVIFAAFWAKITKNKIIKLSLLLLREKIPQFYFKIKNKKNLLGNCYVLETKNLQNNTESVYFMKEE